MCVLKAGMFSYGRATLQAPGAGKFVFQNFGCMSVLNVASKDRLGPDWTAK